MANVGVGLAGQAIEGDAVAVRLARIERPAF